VTGGNNAGSRPATLHVAAFGIFCIREYGVCCVAVIGLLATNSDHIKSLVRDTKCRRGCHRRWKQWHSSQSRSNSHSFHRSDIAGCSTVEGGMGQGAVAGSDIS